MVGCTGVKTRPLKSTVPALAESGGMKQVELYSQPFENPDE